MKILILAPATNIHTARWAVAAQELGHEILVASSHGADSDSGETRFKSVELPGRGLGGHLLNAFAVKKIIREFQPDIVHAHYASTYGLLAKLSGFHPYFVSLWGSDILIFPGRSPLHRLLIKMNLSSADKILSTSQAMIDKTLQIQRSLLDKITLIPFGVDTQKFKPTKRSDPDSSEIVIGTARALKPVYGIDYLIEAFAMASKKIDTPLKLRLEIAGEGSDKEKLVHLARRLGVEAQVNFKGHIDHDQMPQFLQGLDIFVCYSRSESFGVAILEASACGVPVVGSRVGGIPEVIKHLETGLITPANNSSALAEDLLKLIHDRTLREKMGSAGVSFVKNTFEWKDCVQKMNQVYKIFEPKRAQK